MLDSLELNGGITHTPRPLKLIWEHYENHIPPDPCCKHPPPPPSNAPTIILTLPDSELVLDTAVEVVEDHKEVWIMLITTADIFS